MSTGMDKILLGLIKYLDDLSYVIGVDIIERTPIERTELIAWEQRHQICLPPDIKQFYMITNGYELRWKVKMKEKVKVIGHIKISSLDQLAQLLPNKHDSNSKVPTIKEIEIGIEEDTKHFHRKSDGNFTEGDKISTTESQNSRMPTLDKIKYNTNQANALCSSSNNEHRAKPNFNECTFFIVDTCHGYGRVCLVYLSKKGIVGTPTIWFQDLGLEWHYICSSFLNYFKLVVLYHGIPQWQYAFTPWKAPARVQQLISQFVSSKIGLDK